MTIDVSGFGVRVTLFASQTFPQGVDITAMADDADGFDIASVQVRDKAMGVNGDLIVWSKANPLMATINVIPNTPDSDNLDILATANRAAKGRRPVRDVVTAVVSYPDGTQTRYLRGSIMDAVIGKSVASSGRIKTKAYQFAFEDVQ